MCYRNFEKSNQEVCALEGSKYCNFSNGVDKSFRLAARQNEYLNMTAYEYFTRTFIVQLFSTFLICPKNISAMYMNNLKQQWSLLLFNSCKNQKRKYRSSCTTILQSFFSRCLVRFKYMQSIFETWSFSLVCGGISIQQTPYCSLLVVMPKWILRLVLLCSKD